MMSGHVLLLALVALPSIAHAGTNAAGKTFLDANKHKPGVVTLASGMQYKVLEDGDGEAHPLRDTDCTCHYEGRTAQEYSKSPPGKKFDSSFDRGDPTNFAPSGVIAGWTEAMQLMVEGDKWELYIPSELAYGDSGQGGDIGAGDVLVFTLHLLKINGASTPAAPRGPPPYATLTSVAELAEWLTPPSKATAPVPNVLGLFRQPLVGKLFNAFRKAAKLAGGSARFAIVATSKYDPKAGKYTTSDVEAKYARSAPAVLVLSPGASAEASGAGAATPCKTSHSQKSVAVGDVAETILACAKQAKATWDKGEL